MSYITSIRPGKRVGDPVVTDLKQIIKDTKDSVINYKLSHLEDWKMLPGNYGISNSAPTD